MGKRQEIRARRRRRQMLNRILAIAAVIAVALLVTFALILPSLQAPDLGNIVVITPVARTAAVNSTSMGDPAAAVRMDVWEDFQCSGCLAYTQDVEPQVLQAYVETGKVYYTFHNYPFVDGGQGESHQAANAAMCAAAQGRFWDYHDMLFANWLGENADSFTDPRLVAFAEKIGLDMTTFNSCFDKNPYSLQIQQDFQAGLDLGVSSTPSIFVNGERVQNSTNTRYLPSFEDIAAAIEAGLTGR
jgi:protein-disulfide isomerase